MAEAYNLMLRESSGALVAILDGDDLWPPHKLSTQTVYPYNQGFDFTFDICGSVQAGEQTSDIFPSVADQIQELSFNRRIRGSSGRLPAARKIGSKIQTPLTIPFLDGIFGSLA